MVDNDELIDEAWEAWEREHAAIDQIVEGNDSKTIYRVGFVIPTDVRPTDIVLDKPEAVEYMTKWFANATRNRRQRKVVERWGPTPERTTLVKRIADRGATN